MGICSQNARGSRWLSPRILSPILASLAACHDGTSPELGLGELLQIEGRGVQYRPGPFPEDEGGPDAVDLQTMQVNITSGRLRNTFDGTLESGARAFVVGVAEREDAPSDGTWLLPAGIPDFETPGSPSAKATFGVREEFPDGPFELMIAATDENGRFGAPFSTTLVAVPEDPPTGELVIQLAWQGNADLDIHVIEPGPFGGEVFSDDPNSYTPVPGEPLDPNEPPKHGILDRDGNRDCERMANPSEHVVWTMPPPAGEYIVRVDTPSLCGDPGATWYVAVYRTIGGVTEVIGKARGISTPDHVLLPRGRGAGITALVFTL